MLQLSLEQCGIEAAVMRAGELHGAATLMHKRNWRRALRGSSRQGEEEGSVFGVSGCLTLPGRARHGGGYRSSGEKFGEPGGVSWREMRGEWEVASWGTYRREKGR